MSNYQDDSGGFDQGTPSHAAPYGEPAGGSTALPNAPQGQTSQFETPQYSGGGQQYSGSGGGQQNWQPSPSYQGQGHQGQGFFQGGNPLGSSGGHNLKVRATFKTTEFWVLIVVSIALLIAAAVTDQGSDNQGFGAQEAWKYVTWLAIAYIVSRGLTKFAGHERDRGQDRSDRR